MTSHEVNAGNIGVNAAPTVPAPADVERANNVPVVEEDYKSEPAPEGNLGHAVVALGAVVIGVLVLGYVIAGVVSIPSLF